MFNIKHNLNTWSKFRVQRFDVILPQANVTHFHRQEKYFIIKGKEIMLISAFKNYFLKYF